ncbi:MAG: hypothetical protein RLZZ319_546 [Actinomycetota bacterium]|jgi:DME family drug/metabolite transporter
MWGTTGVVAAGMTPDVSTFAIGAFTMGVGGLVLGLITLRDVVTAWRNHRARTWILLGGLGVLVYPLAFYAGMRDAGVAVGNSVALGSGPLFAGLIEWLATKKNPGIRWVVALGVAGIGLAAVGYARASGDSGSVGGIAFALLAGVAYALYSVAGSRVIAAGVPFRGSMGAVFSTGAVPLLVVLAMTGAPILANHDNTLRAAYLALGPTVTAYLFFGFALTRATASLVTLVTLLEPVFATILAVVVLGETLPAIGWAGIALLIVGVAIATVSPRPTASP